MQYTIIQRPAITPQYIEVHEAEGTRARLNPGTPPVYPATAVRCLYSNLSDLYGTDPARRVELWEDSAGTATSSDIFAACTYIRSFREQQIRSEGGLRLAGLATPYLPEERETWPYQRQEALAWNTDHSVPTPYCDIIAAGRGIPRELFLPKVLENSTLFAQASAAILGQQQALIDRIWSEQDFAAFWGLAWS